MNLPLDDLLDFLHRIGVHYTIQGMSRSKSKDVYECRIHVQEVVNGITKTVRVYQGGVNENKINPHVREAVAHAICKFLVHEKHDYHEYFDGGPRLKKVMEDSSITFSRYRQVWLKARVCKTLIRGFTSLYRLHNKISMD